MPAYKINVKNNLKINKNLPLIMHIDMNSFFASCEQQENPLLRNKPLGVVPYLSNKSTVIAASYQAKAFGVKTGTKVIEAKKLCPSIKFVLADPPKYRYINKKFMRVFKKFTPNTYAKSIDEAYLNFADSIFFKNILSKYSFKNKRKSHKKACNEVAKIIKKELHNEIGEYINCSIGVGTNTFLAKVASNINKPNGYYYVDYKNLNLFYKNLQLIDLHGVGPKINSRLNKIGLKSCIDFLNCDINKLKGEFKFFGYQWYLRLRGYECDDITFKQKNIGHSFHLQKFTNNQNYLKIVILKLTEKAVNRLRKGKFCARGFSVYIVFTNGKTFLKSHRIKNHINSTKDIYEQFINLFEQSTNKNLNVKIIGVSISYLKKQSLNLQDDLFGFNTKKQNLNKALDTINSKFGDFTIYPGTLVNYKDIAPDRISFGK